MGQAPERQSSICTSASDDTVPEGAVLPMVPAKPPTEEQIPGDVTTASSSPHDVGRLISDASPIHPPDHRPDQDRLIPERGTSVSSCSKVKRLLPHPGHDTTPPIPPPAKRSASADKARNNPAGPEKGKSQQPDPTTLIT